MAALSPARLPLSVEVLCTADAVYGMVGEIQTLAANGRQSAALSALAYLADAVQGHRPILRGVIAAEREAAQAHDLSERRDIRVICSIGKPQPHAHASNDETQSPSPEQPSPDVA